MIDLPRLFDRISFTPPVAASPAGIPLTFSAEVDGHGGSRRVHRECISSFCDLFPADRSRY
jgi:hypothetical protein